MRQTDSNTASGKFLLRLPTLVHARLQAAARALSISLNEYCCRRLSVPGPSLLMERGAAAAVDRAQALFSEKLIGVLAFGSFVRGDASSASDADLLVVVDGSISLSRALYREWDTEPPMWGLRRVDPHFAHIPTVVGAKPGAWCEAALDGVVLIERDGALTRHLAAMRADIASGRLVRRTVHGQPYWTVAV